MGSFLEINDTLQITKEQGFPLELDIDLHIRRPFKLENFKGKIFEFKNKTNIRIYQMPPVRVFLVENINDKWLYWGRCHILSLNLDYAKKITSGTFEIIELFSPEEMRKAYKLIDGDKEKNYWEYRI